MKTIKFNNKEYQIPQAWDEVTLGMVIKATELDELLPDAPIITVLSAYTGIPVRDLKTSKTTEVQEILAIMSFITEEYKPIPKTSFTLDNIVYSCEDDLLNQKFEDFVSVETALYNYREEPARALPRLLAILCKRDKETLDDFKIDERASLMYGVKLTDAKDIEAFFLHSARSYKVISLLYSTQDLQKELVFHKIKELQDIMKKRKAQSGIFSGTRFRIGYFQIVLWWVKNRLEKYFNLPHTSNSKSNWKQTFKKLVSRKQRKSNGNNNS